MATEDIEAGGLICPCCSRRVTSLRCWSDTATRSPKEVKGCVYWTTGKEADGSDKHTVTIPLFVQPEVKLLVDFHPVWHIQRSSCDGEYNCEVTDVLTNVLHCSRFIELNEWNEEVNAGGHVYHVMFPCIVNTKKIGAGEEVVLKWSRACRLGNIGKRARLF